MPLLIEIKYDTEIEAETLKLGPACITSFDYSGPTSLQCIPAARDAGERGWDESIGLVTGKR
jgi:hypothetical protein